MGLYLPAILRTVDSEVQTITSSAWARRLQYMWYERIVRRRTMDTGVDFIQWLLETARIRATGTGGIQTYSDQMGMNFSIVAKEYGDALRLTEMQILNALGASQNGTERNALDQAANWSRQMGSGGAYWPQEQTAGILVSGTGAALDPTPVTGPVMAYDGQPFFSLSHPINPVTRDGRSVGNFTSGTFTNVFYGRPLTGANYALISAYIQTIPSPDGKPRKIRPRTILTGTYDQLTADQLFAKRSDFYTDPLNPRGNAAGSNIIRELHDTEDPISDADLTCPGAAQGMWWIAAELREDDALAGIIYDERKPFGVRAYTDMSDAEIARQASFEWQFTGWNQVATGHPFLLFQVWANVPAGQVQWMPPGAT